IRGLLRGFGKPRQANVGGGQDPPDSGGQRGVEDPPYVVDRRHESLRMEAEAAKDVCGRERLLRPLWFFASRDRQELPNTVPAADPPSAMRDETSVEQSLQRHVELVTTHPEHGGHAITTEERDAAPVGGERQHHERRRRVWPDLREP